MNESTETTAAPDTSIVARPEQASRHMQLVHDRADAERSQRLQVFADGGQFEVAMRMAEVLSSTSMVPNDYRREYLDSNKKWVTNPDAQGNCIIALDYANRLGVSPLLVMQQVDMVHGRPGLRGAFMGALVNASGLFRSRLKFHFEGEIGKDGYSCYAWAIDHDGEIVKGTTITWAMVKAEGWTKNSKWLSMPEQMIQYRAAAFFSRVHAADVTMGLQTREEIEDVYGEVVEGAPQHVTRLASTNSLQAKLDDAPDASAGAAGAEPGAAGGLPPRKRRRGAHTQDPAPVVQDPAPEAAASEADPAPTDGDAAAETPQGDQPANLFNVE